jgi:plastocyanin
MRRTKSYLLPGLVTVAALSVSGGIGVAAADDDDNGDGGGTQGNTVRTVGEDSFKPNRFVKSTLRFSPGRIRVSEGATVTWQDRDGSTDPHTVTILAAADVPDTVEEVFACGEPGGPCEAALSGHFPSETAPPVPVLNAGEPGLDTVGDSLFLDDGQAVSAEISAPSGTRLSYVCAIHPWMQGSIKAR